MEIHERFAQIRISTGQNKKQFAESLGINQSVSGDIELGKREPSREVMLKLATIYHTNINWLLTGEGNMLALPSSVKSDNDLEQQSYSHKVPLLRQKVSCGSGINWEDEQNIKEYVDIFALVSHLKPRRMFALSVQGNSMVGAGIRNGDYVLFNAGEDQYYDDGIYVFALDGEVYCKLLEFDRISSKIKIYSVRVADLEKAELLTTLNHEDAGFVDRFTIFGRVVSWVHPNVV